jgi:hypothetical protein
MPQYKSVTVTSGLLSTLDNAIDSEAGRQGRDGWRVDSVAKESNDKARIQFIKD